MPYDSLSAPCKVSDVVCVLQKCVARVSDSTRDISHFIQIISPTSYWRSRLLLSIIVFREFLSSYYRHISYRTSKRILSRLILMNRHELVIDLRLFTAITRMTFIWYNLVESTTHQTNTNDLDIIDHDHILSQVNLFLLGIDFSRSDTNNSSHSSSFPLTEVALSPYIYSRCITCTPGRNLFISITQTSRTLDEWLTSFQI